MASNLQLYSKIFAYVNGKLLGQSNSITLNFKSNAQAINTIPYGFQGMSFGSAHIEFSIDNVVPSSGFELDPAPFIGQLKPVEIVFDSASSNLRIHGFITDSNFSQSTDSPIKLSFNGMGEFGVFE